MLFVLASSVYTVQCTLYVVAQSTRKTNFELFVGAGESPAVPMADRTSTSQP